MPLKTHMHTKGASSSSSSVTYERYTVRISALPPGQKLGLLVSSPDAPVCGGVRGVGCHRGTSGESNAKESSSSSSAPPRGSKTRHTGGGGGSNARRIVYVDPASPALGIANAILVVAKKHGVSLDSLLDFALPSRSTYEDFHRDVLKSALVGCIRPYDEIESIRINVPPKRGSRLGKRGGVGRKVVMSKWTSPIQSGCIDILTEAKHFPLDMTLKRRVLDRLVEGGEKVRQQQRGTTTGTKTNPSLAALSLPLNRNALVAGERASVGGVPATSKNGGGAVSTKQRRVAKAMPIVAEMDEDDNAYSTNQNECPAPAAIIPKTSTKNKVDAKNGDGAMCIMESSDKASYYPSEQPPAKKQKFNNQSQQGAKGTRHNDGPSIAPASASLHNTRKARGCDGAVSQPNRAWSSSTQPRTPLPVLIAIADPDPHPCYSYQERVLTPVGPGRVLSSRVVRLPSDDQCLIHPILMYTIDLDYGVCHIPSSQIDAFEETLHAKQRVATFNGVSSTASVHSNTETHSREIDGSRDFAASTSRSAFPNADRRTRFNINDPLSILNTGKNLTVAQAIHLALFGKTSTSDDGDAACCPVLFFKRKAVVENKESQELCSPSVVVEDTEMTLMDAMKEAFNDPCGAGKQVFRRKRGYNNVFYVERGRDASGQTREQIPFTEAQANTKKLKHIFRIEGVAKIATVWIKWEKPVAAIDEGEQDVEDMKFE